MHISFIIVEISKIFGEIGNLVSFIIVGKHKPVRGLAGKGGISGQAWAAQERRMAQAFAASPATGTAAAQAAIQTAASSVSSPAQKAPAAEAAPAVQASLWPQRPAPTAEQPKRCSTRRESHIRSSMPMM